MKPKETFLDGRVLQEGVDGSLTIGMDTRPYWSIQGRPKGDLEAEWEEFTDSLDPKEARDALQGWRGGRYRLGLCAGREAPVNGDTYEFRAIRCQIEDW